MHRFTFITKLREAYQTDPELSKLYTEVETNPASHPSFTIVQGLLLCNGKIYIAPNSPLKSIMIEEFHSSPLGGHAGIQKTYGRLSENFFWQGMKSDVAIFVNSCLVCQSTKPSNHLPYGLLQPIHIPYGIWEDVSMDFIVGLPSFHCKTAILVVVDRFSKAAHFVALPTAYTASQVADLFSQTVCKLYGMPDSIISD